jgi:hypothetical protein
LPQSLLQMLEHTWSASRPAGPVRASSDKVSVHVQQCTGNQYSSVRVSYHDAAVTLLLRILTVNAKRVCLMLSRSMASPSVSPGFDRRSYCPCDREGHASVDVPRMLHGYSHLAHIKTWCTAWHDDRRCDGCACVQRECSPSSWSINRRGSIQARLCNELAALRAGVGVRISVWQHVSVARPPTAHQQGSKPATHLLSETETACSVNSAC